MVTVKLEVRSKGASKTGRPAQEIAFSEEKTSDITLFHLKEAVNTKLHIPSERQRLLTAEKRVLSDEDESKTLDALGLNDGDTVTVKDLGPQISWRLVYIIEYAGPIAIHPLFYFYGSKFIYGRSLVHSKMQTMVFAMIMAHYIKRELETVFVHRFSKATMPLSNVYRNSAYYWIFSGFLLAWPLYSPANSYSQLYGTLRAKNEYLYTLLSVWLFAQISNFVSHMQLRALRPAGTRERHIPYGYGFEIVSCPNYSFEILGWLTVVVMTQSPAVLLFATIGVYFMSTWAVSRHKAYRRQFGDKYPRNRKILIPYLF
ncbi:uncharacterized protein L969DRAFT_87132 [Mixia osmundae IAM 14324]|uniref:Ubiquitin-like domain-containing protein n=1 Tax=Mixia osmundae (strain CBS 9802 / IAM 14324 / JCM 22182 / KY 12970) TaxID=764103 RepID=G7E8C4_MIXOS|nr:uncharacterized protein L969DRAFT_87132 [Mixia osmundae IAM 14324]KEI39187.1 hypothetical protein L969DRAFT_87132 [Mixia osmundae IAM 14324]GAA99084.1 hypothetical protein E5Q_05773 [Mixia osmundae IAM 14324]